MGIAETAEAQTRVGRPLREAVRRKEEVKLKRKSQGIRFTEMVNYSSLG